MKLTENEAGRLAESLNYHFHGLITAIVQDSETKEVLMVAYMNQEAVKRTLLTGRSHFWSRKRERPWLKGETSGHFQEVESLLVDCDEDTLLLKVRQVGYPCHKGYSSCFFRKLEKDGLRTILPCIGNQAKEEE
jgi:phosphoribosyl-AMP cyclohydrolase